jgi:predicted NBD/HSP70 family sugar kinase
VDNGQICRCGHAGCLETVASSRAIVERAKAAAGSNPDSFLHRYLQTPEAITTEVVLEAFKAGDETIQQIIAEAGYYLGIATANLVGALNIQRILIGGSVARFGRALIEPIRREMRQQALAALADETMVEETSLGEDIVILGAAALLLSRELGLV